MTGRVQIVVMFAALTALAAAWPAAAQDTGVAAVVPLEIDAAELQLIPAYAPARDDTAEQHLSITPQEAFLTWAQGGLRAVGQRNRVVVIIRDARIVETPAAMKEGAAAWLSRQSARRFGGTMAVEVRIHNVYGTMVGRMDVRASADATVYEGGTPAQHTAALRAVRSAMIDRIAQALQAGFQTHLAGFLLRSSSSTAGDDALPAQPGD